MTGEPVWGRLETGHSKAPPATDLVIVGGGITGVSLLLHLQRLGLRALLLERERVGAGASGRNAGFMMAGIASNYAEAVRIHSRLVAREAWAFTVENQRRLAETLPAGSADYSVPGSLKTPWSPAEAGELQESAELLAEDGFDARWNGVGLENPDDGVVHPVRMLGALMALVKPGSVLLGVEVRELETGAGGVRLRLAGGGECRAGAAVLATNAYSKALVPGLPIEPKRAQMLATAPGPAGPLTAHYADRGYVYHRRLPNGRLLLGGFRNRALDQEVGFDATPSTAVQAHLDGHLREHLGGGRVTHRWAGIMGFTPDDLPLVGAVPGRPALYLSAGYTGHGMAFAHLCALRLAEHLAGGPKPPPWLNPDRFGPGTGPT